MVIGMLILLIVAVVVINMFMRSTESITSLKKYQEDTRYQNFKAECEGYCNEYAGGKGEIGSVTKFCYTKLKDLVNKATVRDDVLKDDRTGIIPICGDAIYCFHVVGCEGIDGSQCRKILCNAFYDQYKDFGKASQKVLDIFTQTGTTEESRIGSCYEKINKDENWWNLYFAKDGPLPCGGTLPTTTSPTQKGTLTCSAFNKNIKCSWSGCPTDKCNLMCSADLGTCAQPLRSFNKIENETIYMSMTTGRKYVFALQDSNFNTIAGPVTVACC